MRKPHILIVGAQGVGKSTLIRKLLRETDRPVYGYYTISTARDETGYHKIYIHDASSAERRETAENCIGDCNRKIHNANTGVFDSLGAAYIRAAKPGGIIVMDELGFLEAEAKTFTGAVLDALAGDIPVIAAVKNRTDVPFLDAVRGSEKATCHVIDEENRDALFKALRENVSLWYGSGDAIQNIN